MKNKHKFGLFCASVLLAIILPIISLCSIGIEKNVRSNLDIFSTANAVYVTGDFKNKVESVNDALNCVNETLKTFNLTNVKKQLSYKQTINLTYGKSYQFEQIHDGFYVYGKQLSVTVDNYGKVLAITGNVDGNIRLSINENLLEPKLSNELIDFEPYTISETKMVVYEKNNIYYFCYQLLLNTEQCAYYCFIDAYTGKLIDALPLGDNLSQLPTSGYSVYKESVAQKDAHNKDVTVVMEKYVASSGDDTFYLLADSSKNIYMADNKNKTTYSGYEYYASADGKIADSIAVTAYINLISSYDFYKDFLNVEGISDGDGGLVTLTALVHYGNSYHNAAYAYTSSSTSHYFIFGDGGEVYHTNTETGESEYQFTYKNFVYGLDVVGHEYTHAMTRSIVDFQYLNEAGALSEAYSDMFGAMIEANLYGYTFETSDFWALGEDLIVEDGLCVRNLKNPKIKHYTAKIADCTLAHDHDYAGCDRGGVHSNCQIFTYAIYKMYESGTFSDISTLANLLYSSLAYLTPTSTLADSRAALLTAASHLNLGDDVQDKIMQAFADVGIGKEMRSYSFYIDENKAGEPIVVNAEIGSQITIPECSFEIDGKYFWYWTSERGEILEVGESITMGSEDLSFYAVWSDNELSVLEGKGNSLSPYLIEDALDLKTVAYYVNNAAYDGIYNTARYKINSDIDLGGVLWMPIGTKENPFNGTFDGGKCKITNLNLCATNSDYNGLFGYVGNGAYIFDIITFSGTINTSAKYTGAIAGFSKGTIVTSVNHINIISDNVAGGIVGLAEANEGAILENCYNEASISAKVAGGLIGQAVSPLFQDDDRDLELYLSVYVVNCYNIGFVGGDVAGGICGKANGFYFVNCINNGQVQAASGIAGGIIGEIMLRDEVNAPLVLPTKTVYAGLFSCRSSGLISGEIVGALIGNANLVNASGKIYIEKNIVNENYLLIGNEELLDESMLGVFVFEENIKTTNNAYEGLFDYDNIDYFLNDTWTTINGFSPYDFVFTWMIVENAMPQFTDLEFWLNEGVDYITSLLWYESAFEGNGTAASPYEISTPQQLAALSVYVANGYSFAGAYFKQTKDIDLAGKVWVGIGMMYNAATDVNHPFSGNFDGNGYVIKNMQGTTLGSIVEDADYTSGYRTLIYFGSLFGMTAPYVQSVGYGSYVTYTPSIKNVMLQNSKVSGNYAGGVVGLAFSTINIENCYNINGIAASSNFAGGIVGYLGNNDVDLSYTNIQNKATNILNCYSSAVVSGSVAGGIIGYAENINNDLSLTVNIINCANEGVVLSAGMDAIIEGSYVAGSVGGIMGTTSASETNFINCLMFGLACGYNKECAVGGILGTIGMKEFGVTIPNISFMGCKVKGELKNKADNTSEKVAALIGSSSGKELSTVNITEISQTHYLSKYNAFGKNIKGELLTTNAYNGSNNSAYDVGNEDYFTSQLFVTDHTFDSDIINLMRSAETITVKFKVNGEIVKEIQIKAGCSVENFIPTKESTKYYEYKFIGWSEDINFVTADTTIVARFEQVARKYTVVYKDGDRVYTVVVYGAGETLSKTPISGKNPSKESDFFYDYTFDGWDCEGQVFDDLEVNAIYKKHMKIEGALLLLFIFIAIFAIPIFLVVRSHFKKKLYN